MKSYPSIPRGHIRSFQAHVFDKIDGSLIRWEWSKKRGWYKYGTRTRLFDEADSIFGSSITLFHDTLAAPIADIVKAQRWDRVIAFTEFHGPHSFAGKHQQGDPMNVSLIDVAPYKRGLLPPKEYLDLFGHIEFKAKYIGKHDWDAEFVRMVREGELLDHITFEGVVGKAEINKKIIMAKAKTQAWIDKVMQKFGDAAGKAIVES